MVRLRRVLEKSLHACSSAAAIAVILVAACSETTAPVPPPSETKSATGGPSAGGPEGVVEGRVIFAGGEIPTSTKVKNTTDPQHCGRVHSLENIIVSPENRGIKNAIVALTGIELPADYEAPPSRLVLDNRECRFEPHAAVLTVGGTIEAVNSDPIYHSVHLYGLKELNVSLHVSKSRVIELPNRPGFLIVKCDVHGWMQSYIRVDRHPFHAVTGADGRFRIEGAPKGTYPLEVWHEHFGSQKNDVTIEPNAATQLTISFPSKKEATTQ